MSIANGGFNGWDMIHTATGESAVATNAGVAAAARACLGGRDPVIG